MKVRNTSSLGHPNEWGMVAHLVVNRPNQWRKVARFVANIRHRWISSESPEEVRRRTHDYARRAYRDTILPAEVMFYLRQAVMAEFQFDINPQ
jgi:hypothetical protein